METVQDTPKGYAKRHKYLTLFCQIDLTSISMLLSSELKRAY